MSKFMKKIELHSEKVQPGKFVNNEKLRKSCANLQGYNSALFECILLKIDT